MESATTRQCFSQMGSMLLLLVCLPACSNFTIAMDIPDRPKAAVSAENLHNNGGVFGDDTIFNTDTAQPEGQKQMKMRSVEYIHKPKERSLAFIHMASGEGKDMRVISFDVRKEARAYMIQAPLFPEETYSPHLAFGAHKDFKAVAMVRWKLAF